MVFIFRYSNVRGSSSGAYFENFRYRFSIPLNFTTNHPCDRETIIQTLGKCARPHLFYNGCILREVSGRFDLKKYTSGFQKLLSYGLYNLTYELQKTLIDCCTVRDFETAVDELKIFFVGRVRYEMQELGNDPSKIIRFKNFAMSPQAVYIHHHHS